MGEIQFGPVNSLIAITPDFGFEQIKTLVNRQDQRTKEGTLFTYIENGQFTQFSLPWSWVSSSQRSLVNSWWETATDLKFVIDSDFPSSSFDVRIMESEEPLTSFIRPYGPGESGTDVFYEGEIIIETT